MSAHDFLASEARRVKALLEEYIEEFGPVNGDRARAEISQFIITVDKFVAEEPQQE